MNYLTRKVKRNIMRKEFGNRNLADTWERYQRDKYGEDYPKICRKHFRRKK